MLLTESEILELMSALQEEEEEKMEMQEIKTREDVRVHHCDQDTLREVLRWHLRPCGKADDPVRVATMGRCDSTCPFIAACEDVESCKLIIQSFVKEHKAKKAKQKAKQKAKSRAFV